MTICYLWQIRLLGRDAGRKHEMLTVGCLLASRCLELDLPKFGGWVVPGRQDLRGGDDIQVEGFDIPSDLRSQLLSSQKVGSSKLLVIS